MHLLSLALNHAHIAISCNLTLPMPFRCSHFLNGVKGSSALVASLIISLFSLQRILILLQRRYIVQIHFGHVLVRLIGVYRNASIITHNLKLIILFLLIWLILTWFINVLAQFCRLWNHLITVWLSYEPNLILITVNLLQLIALQIPSFLRRRENSWGPW